MLLRCLRGCYVRQVIMPALERYLQEMNQLHPQQQPQLSAGDITFDVHSSSDDDDCRTYVDTPHDDGLRLNAVYQSINQSSANVI